VSNYLFFASLARHTDMAIAPMIAANPPEAVMIAPSKKIRGA
jgi:hypothetical protein